MMSSTIKFLPILIIIVCTSVSSVTLGMTLERRRLSKIKEEYSKVVVIQFIIVLINILLMFLILTMNFQDVVFK